MHQPAPRRLSGAPSVRALLAQAGAFPLTLIAVWLLARMGLPMSWEGVALVQGAWAALLASWLGLAIWWRAIELVFPSGVLLARGLDLPPGLFLVLFVLFLLVYWSTFRTQVPYYPSGRGARDAVADALPAGRPLAIVDVGSGLGGLVLDLARRRPDAQVDGIELAPLPWCVSRLRATLSGSRARFLRGDYETLNFGHYDVVFAYLSPAAMAGLWRKAESEMRPGSMLLSYEFDIPGRMPDRRIVTTNSKKILYLWQF
jgi:SAM-dependent methyltransferase